MRFRASVRAVSAVLTASMFLLSPLSAVDVRATSSIYNTETGDLLMDISKAMPIIEEILTIKEEYLQERIKAAIKRENLDYEYTMWAYEDLGNPYKDVDYNDLIAAYATVSEFGRNGKELFMDVPYITVTLKKEEIKGEDGRYFGVPSFSVMSGEDLLRYYGYEEGSDAFLAYEYKKKRIEEEIDKKSLSQTVFVKTKESVRSEATDTRKWLPIAERAGSELRKTIVLTAMSLMGQVPYQWGGKAQKPGYDKNWWTYNGNGEQKGLDCSGFVQWAYMTAGFPQEVTKNLQSTTEMRQRLISVDEDELRPGDIGLLYAYDNGLTNHAGIYVGEGWWVHCSSGAGTVVINKFDFKQFYTVLFDIPEENGYTNKVKYTAKTMALSNSSIRQMRALQDAERIENGENYTVFEEEGDEESEEADSQDAGLENETPEDESLGYIESHNENEAQAEETAEDEQEEVETPEPEESGTEEAYVEVEPAETTPEAVQRDAGEQTAVNDSDVLLLARLIQHEARYEGFNGWVAVGEVVVNRVASPEFPGTIKEVIYQKKQFTNAHELAGIDPTPEIMEVARQVLSGSLKIFENENVLFFRNPSYAGYASTDKVNWGSYKWYQAVGHHAFYLR